MRQPKRRKLSSPPSDKIANLCGACKVLSFNDKDVGSHEKEDSMVAKFLALMIMTVRDSATKMRNRVS
jgi:hypothetical protein